MIAESGDSQPSVQYDVPSNLSVRDHQKKKKGENLQYFGTVLYRRRGGAQTNKRNLSSVERTNTERSGRGTLRGRAFEAD